MNSLGNPANSQLRVAPMNWAIKVALTLIVNQHALASAVILTPDHSVALGVNDFGHLNVLDPAGLITTISTPHTAIVGGVGLAFNFGTEANPQYFDGTNPGCACEGWGISGSGHSAQASGSSGARNLTLDTFATDATASSNGTEATSVVRLASLPEMRIIQRYRPVENPNANNILFENDVFIANQGTTTITDVRYVRAMDWDIPPTEFEEFVTIIGTGTTTTLEMSHDAGSASLNPIRPPGRIERGLNPGTVLTDFVDVNGPFTDDHGAYFRFNFGDLEAGETLKFTVYYGVAEDETEALAALGEVGAELFSLGQSTSLLGTADNNAPTFIFAFGGVAGTSIIADPTPLDPSPEPTTSVILLALGAVMLTPRPSW